MLLSKTKTAAGRFLFTGERSTSMPHSRLASIACCVGLLGSVSAWLPFSVTTPARVIDRARMHTGDGREAAAALAPLRSSTRDGVERPDLAALKKGFEQSMDGKLVMEYVTVRAVNCLSRCCCPRVFHSCEVLIFRSSRTRPYTRRAALHVQQQYSTIRRARDS